MNDYNTEPFKLNDIEGVIVLEGYLFIKKQMIEQNDPLVSRTFSDLYRYISKN